MTSIPSVELNFLVFRYLHESGFTHSAFALRYEAGIDKSSIDGNLVPPGALITFVQKGLQYIEMEANLSNSETDMDEDFSFLQPSDLITRDVYELRQIIKERKKNQQKGRDKEFDGEHEGDLNQAKEREKHHREKGREKDRVKTEKDKGREKQHEDQTDREMVTDEAYKVKVRHEENGIHCGTEPMDISTNSASQACEIPSSDVIVLEGHTSEVCACAWSPAGSILASGSGDSTARIWTIADVMSRSSLQNGHSSVVVLKHVKGKTNEKNKDVTTLDWNVEGRLLATGSYDGQARIWSTNSCKYAGR